jgi:hypothetical protein
VIDKTLSAIQSREIIMNTTLHKFLIGTSIAVSVSGIGSAPAFAGSLSGAKIGGTAATDYLIYSSDTKNTFTVDKNNGNLQKALDGNSATPGGNVELRASSEAKTGFDFTKNTTLEGKIGGRDIVLSSLTEIDWFATSAGTIDKTYGADTFATKWFNTFFGNAINPDYKFLDKATARKFAFDNFSNSGGFQASSDPNIAYVNQDDKTGVIDVGLAGHYDVTAFYAPLLGKSAALLKNSFQASEVVKYTYNGKSDYLYSFQANKSGLVEKIDGKSHSGIYQASFQGIKPNLSTSQSVPEPSVLLGLIGVSGIFGARGKLKK